MMPLACTCARLRRSARIVGALYDSALAPAGLTVAQYSLLRMLEKAGPSSLTRFGAASGYDRTTLNRTLRPLEEAGLVESGSGKDARARIVAVSEAGRAALRSAEPLWEAAQARVEGHLGEGREALDALLGRLEELKP